MASVDLDPVGFDSIDAIFRDDLGAAFRVFRRSAEIILSAAQPLRAALPADEALARVCRIAAGMDAARLSQDAALDFFAANFRPFRLRGPGFVTAYYEPVIEAREAPEAGFRTPVPARPADLVTLNERPIRGEAGEALTSARRRDDGGLEPYPDRRALEEGPPELRPRPIAYVRDRVELFLIQVQGSARLRYPGGRDLPLTYDGRNGRPYTSIGRLLIERGLVPQNEMSLERLKTEIRALGQEDGAPGARLMQENRSYVFFRADSSPERRDGPIGGEGCALAPLRSIAVDRSLWSYGLPFFITATLPWRSAAAEPFARLMIAQDTGSAILGPARADLFFGAGDEAGALAGLVRHNADFTVLLPRGAVGDE
ncbi:membrane-bound lytic murein transglycosylase A [Methylosinus sp. sav-2]|uniref:murein transglycosylase A n=1 Tax=Methylosinus sp. sav-2 TaxID=2485168 RepID=UPI00047DF5C1|nr:MltA domain-containing protein [Methylosinus sp. sav-2]TDX67013.1 membrane-bound lytic murein transglycosylase A [Methylosinus sp. sav-2]